MTKDSFLQTLDEVYAAAQEEEGKATKAWAEHRAALDRWRHRDSRARRLREFAATTRQQFTETTAKQ